MDMGTAATYCVGILTFGGLVLAFLRFFRFKNGNPGNSSGRNFTTRFEERIRKEFVSVSTCKANIKGIETAINLTKESLEDKIDGLNETFKEGIKALRREIKD